MRRFSRLIIIMVSLGMFFSTTLVAQDSTKSTMQTLFGGKGAKYKINYLGIYFAPEFQYGQLDGSFTSMGGMSMMLQVNKKWGIGMTGFSGRGSNTDTIQNRGHFAGLKLEYTPKPNARFHVSFPLMVGMGQIGGRDFGDNMGKRNGRNHRGFGGDDDRFDYNGIERSSYAVIQPGISAEANLFRYTKVFAGANYRFAFNSNGNSTVLQGFSTNVGVKIGVFDYELKDKKSAKKIKKHLKE